MLPKSQTEMVPIDFAAVRIKIIFEAKFTFTKYHTWQYEKNMWIYCIWEFVKENYGKMNEIEEKVNVWKYKSKTIY